MTKRVYKYTSEGMIQVAGEREKDIVAPYVHQDTFKAPLRHPKTDEMVDSMTRWNEINKEHKLECVGNDLLSKHKREVKEKITDERFDDAYQHAWAIETDPFKRNQRINRQREEVEKYHKASSQKLTAGMPLKDIIQMMGFDK